MKLRSIYLISKEHYSEISAFGVSQEKVNGVTMYRISNWKEYMNILLQLQRIDLYRERAGKIIDAIPEYYVTKDFFRLDAADWRRVEEANRDLKNVVKIVIELYESMGFAVDEKIGIDIKMPPCKDITEYAGYINDLNYVFTKCPFLQTDQEKWIFDSVDVGSAWITLLIEGGAILTGGSILLNNLAAFIDKCIAIKSHYISTQEQKLELKKTMHDQARREIIEEYIDSDYRKCVDAAIKEMEEISNYHVENIDGDENGRIEEAFKRMGDLIDKGLQIYSTIDSPKETKLLFEPLEMHYESIEEKLKLLMQKDNKE